MVSPRESTLASDTCGCGGPYARATDVMSKLIAALALAALLGAIAIPPSAAQDGELDDDVVLDGEADGPEYEFSGGDEMDAPSVKIRGRGGRIELGRGRNADGDSNRLRIKVIEVRELSADGEAVGRRGVANRSDRHSQKIRHNPYTVSDEWADDEVEGVQAKSLTLTAEMLDGEATLTMNVFLIKESGDVVIEGEECVDGEADGEMECGTVEEVTPVFPGTLKLTASIDDWIFCNEEQDDVDAADYCADDPSGAYLELDILVDAKANIVKVTDDDEDSEASRLRSLRRRKRPVKYDMGGTKVDFSTMVQVDGVWHEMEAGFPSMRRRESNGLAVYTLRFPRGQHLVYDPTITLAEVSGASPAGPSVAMLFAAAVIALVAVQRQ